MSECVVRMEMPRCCDECPMEYDGFMCAAIHKRFYPKKDGRYLEPLIDPAEQRLPDCPIVCALPEKHGRLVDADAEIKHHLCDFVAFEAEHGKEETYGKFYSINDLWIGITEAFNTADMIVPATEGGNE